MLMSELLLQNFKDLLVFVVLFVVLCCLVWCTKRKKKKALTSKRQVCALEPAAPNQDFEKNAVRSQKILAKEVVFLNMTTLGANLATFIASHFAFFFFCFVLLLLLYLFFVLRPINLFLKRFANATGGTRTHILLLLALACQ